MLRDPEMPSERMRDLCLETAAHELGFEMPQQALR
jgi:hypothetical protein